MITELARQPEVANIDFDIFLYKYGFGYQKTTHTLMDGDDIYQEFDKISEAKEARAKVKDEQGLDLVLDSYVKPDPLPIVYGALNKEIAQIMENTFTRQYQGFISGPGNYRLQLATICSYKKSRKSLKKPYHYQSIKEFLIKNHNTIVTQGIEADDALGIAQDPEGSTVICSIDKDLRITPGRHYNLTSKKMDVVDEFGEIQLVAKERTKKLTGGGKKFHYAQMLMGDTTDDIPGIPGMGDVKVYNALNDCKTELECYKVVKERYMDHYGTHYLPLMVQVARLLWVQQKEGDIWLPPGVEEL